VVLDVRRELANRASAQITNLLARDYPGGKAELFIRIYEIILQAMCIADEECAARWKESSLN
jgi:hypothetical protein